MAEGIDRLHSFPGTCQRVDVTALVGEASALRDELLRLGPERMGERDVRRALRIRVATD